MARCMRGTSQTIRSTGAMSTTPRSRPCSRNSGAPGTWKRARRSFMNFSYEFQRYEAEQQYYVYANSIMFTASWRPYVKNYAPNQTFDYGSRAAALRLDR